MTRFSRLVVAGTIASLLSGFAMAADAPWKLYACTSGNMLKAKLPADGGSAKVKLGKRLVLSFDSVQREEKLNVLKGRDGLQLVVKDKVLNLTGSYARGGPYLNCTAS